MTETQTTRGLAIVNDEDINKIVDNAIPKNTKRGTKFGMKSNSQTFFILCSDFMFWLTSFPGRLVYRETYFFFTLQSALNNS